MKKPIILIGGGPACDRVFEDSAIMLNKTYSLAVAAGGGVPLIAVDENLVDEYVDMVDGLILSGSISYAPTDELLAKKVATEGRVYREEFDKLLFKAFFGKKPILGICLGLQVINEELGGTLIDGFKFSEGIEHMMCAHSVKAEEGSVLHKLYGPEFMVNSRHNRKIGKLAKGLKVTALSPDGVIEAIEHEEMPLTAYEWHPERMRGDIPEPPTGPDMTSLFQWFADECVKHKNS